MRFWVVSYYSDTHTCGSLTWHKLEFFPLVEASFISPSPSPYSYSIIINLLGIFQAQFISSSIQIQKDSTHFFRGEEKPYYCEIADLKENYVWPDIFGSWLLMFELYRITKKEMGTKHSCVLIFILRVFLRFLLPHYKLYHSYNYL